MSAKNSVFDLEEAVKAWAWDEYTSTENRRQRKLRQKEFANPNTCLCVNADWSHVSIVDESKWPRLQQVAFDDVDHGGSDDALNVKFDAQQLREEGQLHVSTLFKTKFTNSTNEQQEYTIRSEKTTCSEWTTEVENSWSRSFEVGISLKTPGEILEANAGFSREVSLSNTHGETFEEQLTWGVESQLKVKANHVAEASLVVNEKKYAGSFEVVSRVRGMVYATFTNLRDNNALVKATGDDIAAIVAWFVQRQRRKNITYPFVDVSDDVVTIRTRGKCNFKFGVNQEVHVTQTPI